jgi:hypothetical protein
VSQADLLRQLEYSSAPFLNVRSRNLLARKHCHRHEKPSTMR